MLYHLRPIVPAWSLGLYLIQLSCFRSRLAADTFNDAPVVRSSGRFNIIWGDSLGGFCCVTCFKHSPFFFRRHLFFIHARLSRKDNTKLARVLHALFVFVCGGARDLLMFKLNVIQFVGDGPSPRVGGPYHHPVKAGKGRPQEGRGGELRVSPP